VILRCDADSAAVFGMTSGEKEIDIHLRSSKIVMSDANTLIPDNSS
jgi:hypothetical protein